MLVAALLLCHRLVACTDKELTRYGPVAWSISAGRLFVCRSVSLRCRRWHFVSDVVKHNIISVSVAEGFSFRVSLVFHFECECVRITKSIERDLYTRSINKAIKLIVSANTAARNIRPGWIQYMKCGLVWRDKGRNIEEESNLKQDNIVRGL